MTDPNFQVQESKINEKFLKFITPYCERSPYWTMKQNEYDCTYNKYIFDELDRLNGAPIPITVNNVRFFVVGLYMEKDKVFFTLAKYK